jgi:dTDP-4-amino-4,6-dideoxygalactose transaminase
VAGATGDVGVLSFGGSKLMTAGRGGAVLTSNELFNQRALVFCGQGNDAFAMSELQAAVLRPQLESLDHRNQIRSTNARSLVASLSECEELHNVRLPDAPDLAGYFKIPWRISKKSRSGSPIDRELFLRALEAEGLAVGEGFRGFTKRSNRRCRKPVSLKNAEAAIEGTVLLHHPILLCAPEEVERVARTLMKTISAFRDGSLSTSVDADQK